MLPLGKIMPALFGRASDNKAGSIYKHPDIGIVCNGSEMAIPPHPQASQPASAAIDTLSKTGTVEPLMETYLGHTTTIGWL